MIKVSERELKCLKVLNIGHEDYFDDDLYWYEYKYIAKNTKLTFCQARRSVRALKRKGLAEYSQLFNEDGFVNGSGHHITEEGWNYLRTLND